MIRNISVGIDVGTTATRVVVSEFLKGEKMPKVIGTGFSLSSGIKQGYIFRFDDTVKGIKKAIDEAEKSSGVKIRRAFVSIGGVTMSSETSVGTSVISKADGEVTALDVNKAMQESEDELALGNKKVIHAFPLYFKLDGKEVLGRPEGMRGMKLEVKTLFVACSSQHLDEMLSAIVEAGVEPIDVIASPIAGSHIALTEKQKMVGVALVNIGAETTSIGVFENGTLLSANVFKIGSSDITNDIALGLKIPLEEAEELKLGTGSGDYSKKKLDEIIDARLSDIFEYLENHLKKIKRNGLLPAGIVFIGGGANSPMLESLSKEMLRLPSKIGSTEMFGAAKTKLRDSAWFTALGLCISGSDTEGYSEGTFPNLIKDLKNSIKSITKQLMP